jgi:hypothetical protein
MVAPCAIIERDVTVGQPRARVASSVAALGLACGLACGEVKHGGGGSTMVDAADRRTSRMGSTHLRRAVDRRVPSELRWLSTQ